MIVVDASAVVDLLLGTDRAPHVAQALSGESAVHAPELLDPEVVSVVRRWHLRGWIGVRTASRAIAELADLAVVRHRHAGLRQRTWELRHRCSAYDGFYVALSEVLDADLLSTDERLRRSATDLVPLR